ncbi:DUF2304 domain-containing protein [Solirubrobacter soli]|uniref:DUF2304 domain-containing protein n=1 Tax=Solirubrobacter soli TaxID=363832 RepID=UPI000405B0DF|nr:DUF2304 domain-containing protein [Solirubrobacter soli]
MDSSRIQILIICVAAMLLVGVIDLVRRRRLLERYAMLWLLSSLVLLALAVWRGALDKIAESVGVAYPPNALFIVAFGFVLWMLLHFSIAVSRLSDQTKILAQRIAMLEERMRRQEVEANGNDADDEPEEAFAQLGSRGFRRSGKR